MIFWELIKSLHYFACFAVFHNWLVQYVLGYKTTYVLYFRHHRNLIFNSCFNEWNARKNYSNFSLFSAVNTNVIKALSFGSNCKDRLPLHWTWPWGSSSVQATWTNSGFIDTTGYAKVNKSRLSASLLKPVMSTQMV